MKMSKLGPKCQYFVWPPLFSSTALTLLGMEFTRASQVATGVLFHSSMTTSRSWWMLETLRSSTFRLRIPHRCSIVFRCGDILGQYIIFTLSSLARQWSSWTCVWGRYHVGILPCGPVSEGRGSCSASDMLAFMVPSMNCSSPVMAALMQNNLMQCVAYGLSTNKLTPHPFNLCSNAGSTHTSISQTQPLDMTLRTCTQLLWSTMARHVLSGTSPVKPLYGLCHRAAAQFLGLGNSIL